MSDEQGRRRERLQAQSGDPRAGARLLLGRLREGTLSPKNLRLLAYLGDPGAVLAFAETVGDQLPRGERDRCWMVAATLTPEVWRAIAERIRRASGRPGESFNVNLRDLLDLTRRVAALEQAKDPDAVWDVFQGILTAVTSHGTRDHPPMTWGAMLEIVREVARPVLLKEAT